MIPLFGDARDWFFQRRFGAFVHWGIYAIPAWQEQVRWRRSIPRLEYAKYALSFNPSQFNPDAWLDLFESVGMEYVVFTAKHHDGFCMWDTRQTDFNVMHTPYGRDIVGELAAACRRRRMPLGLYYSVVDWNHVNYPNQGRSHEFLSPDPGDEPSIDKYMLFLRAQVRELCTQYGELCSFWWDMNVTGHTDPSINAMIRSLQPNAVINNRGFDPGDFKTPERHFDDQDSMAVFEQPTEACDSLGSQSWGYKSDEDYFSDRHLMSAIDRALAKGGNYLLNIGPTAEGTVCREQVDFLRRIGRWLRLVRESYADDSCAEMAEKNLQVLFTRRGNALYVHLNQVPASSAVWLRPLDVLPARATILNTGARAETDIALHTYSCPGGRPCLRVRNLPVNSLANEVIVLKLEFDSWPALSSACQPGGKLK